MIIDSLIQNAQKRASAHRLSRITIGLGYLAVTIDDGRTGLAYVFRNQLGPNCSILTDAGSLEDHPLNELISWAKEDNLLQAALGVAAINALAEPDEVKKADTGSDEWGFTRDQKVGMIGYFTPVAKAAQEAGATVYAFDSQRSELPEVYPDQRQKEYLPFCDTLVVTGTTVINKSIDEIMGLAKPGASISLLGFSTPLYPEVFAGTPVTLLKGSMVSPADSVKVHKIISQSGGGKHLGKVAKKVNLKVPIC